MSAGIAALVVRCGMVVLFLPFSALDKFVNFHNAVNQAQEVFRPRALAVAVLMTGLAIEIFCTLGVVTGIADRASAFIIAGYCAVTALLFKRFWDFLKNLSLGAGFLLLVVGADGTGLQAFVDHPFASTHPYGSSP
jgi:putative oxidoreductase